MSLLFIERRNITFLDRGQSGPSIYIERTQCLSLLHRGGRLLLYTWEGVFLFLVERRERLSFLKREERGLLPYRRERCSDIAQIVPQRPSDMEKRVSLLSREERVISLYIESKECTPSSITRRDGPSLYGGESVSLLYSEEEYFFSLGSWVTPSIYIEREHIVYLSGIQRRETPPPDRREGLPLFFDSRRERLSFLNREERGPSLEEERRNNRRGRRRRRG